MYTEPGGAKGGIGMFPGNETLNSTVEEDLGGRAKIA